jgi:hypothetical protein
MSQEQPIDVRAMAIVHRMFHNGFDESARLVRATPAPSPARATFLADHVDFLTAMLHVHHEGEDELLYPKLIERAPEQAAVTEQTQDEHQLIQTALDVTSAACAAWRARPRAETGEALAASLDQLNSVTTPHLDAEEQKVIPLAAVTLTQREWDDLGRHSVAFLTGARKAIAFGMILEPLGEADRSHIMHVLPPPVRILYPFLIDRPWKKYAATLRTGT